MDAKRAHGLEAAMRNGGDEERHIKICETRFSLKDW